MFIQFSGTTFLCAYNTFVKPKANRYQDRAPYKLYWRPSLIYAN